MIGIDLSGKVAIVVGASRGIGEAIALKMAEAGATVIASSRNLEAIEGVAAKIKEAGGEAEAYAVDVSKRSDMDALVAAVVDKYGKVDIMVNNAGVNKIKLFKDSTNEELDRILDVNLRGVYNGCRAVVEQMLKQKSGKILNVASQAAKEAFDFHSMYSASKFGVIGMSQVMAKELARFNINVNCICPGIVKTEMWDKNLEEFNEYGRPVDPEIRWQKVVASIPMQRPQTPEDMAYAAVFLCSDLAMNISGQSLLINGAAVCD
jgi:meso-butanediol dehydrogenase/(S,S)-butanediol dehydrogenase/diacetyl reductase